MRRSVFLRNMMAAASALSLPFASFGRRGSEKSGGAEKSRESGKFGKSGEPKESGTRVDKGFLVAAGKGRFDKSISLFEGDTFFTKVSTRDTNGDLYMYESVREKKGGPPLHIHYDQDEWWYVLQGEFMIKVGEQVFNVKAGDSVFGPRKVPHAFAKVGEGEAKLLMLFQPAGKMEEFFTSMSQGVAKNMTPEQGKEFRKAHGFEVVGPALTYLKQ